MSTVRTTNEGPSSLRYPIPHGFWKGYVRPKRNGNYSIKRIMLVKDDLETTANQMIELCEKRGWRDISARLLSTKIKIQNNIIIQKNNHDVNIIIEDLTNELNEEMRDIKSLLSE